MSNIKESYSDVVETLREMGAALIPATAAQYEAPPSGPASSPNDKGVKNPTLDIVTDPRRSSLSDAVHAADVALRQARSILAPHAPALRQAVARWEGQEGPSL